MARSLENFPTKLPGSESEEDQNADLINETAETDGNRVEEDLDETSEKTESESIPEEQGRRKSSILRESLTDTEKRESVEPKRRVRVSMDDQILTFPPINEEHEKSEDDMRGSFLEEVSFLPSKEVEPDLEHLFDQSYQEEIDESISRASLENVSEQSLPENREKSDVAVDLFAHFNDQRRFSAQAYKDFVLDQSAPFAFAQGVSSQVSLQVEDSRIEEERKEAKLMEDKSLDRSMYYQLYNLFSEKRKNVKMINNFLQSKMAEYYLRRKMFHVLKEPVVKQEEVLMYERQVDTFGEVCENSERERQQLTDEIESLREKRQANAERLNFLFKKLQQAESDYGKTLTFERTGRANMDKLLERFLKRQRNQTILLSELRLDYYKLRNKFNETTKALDDLDNLGPGYHIMDYVQLKFDNRNLHDKLEEKETELTKLSANCKSTMQIAAHNREKAAVMDLDIKKTKEELEATDQDFFDAREDLSYLKQDRDYARQQMKKLRSEYGLLTHPKLLRDMGNALKEVKTMESEIKQLKAGSSDADQKIKIVKKKMEAYIQTKRKEEQDKYATKFVPKSTTSQKIPESVIVKPSRTVSFYSL